MRRIFGPRPPSGRGADCKSVAYSAGGFDSHLGHWLLPLLATLLLSCAPPQPVAPMRPIQVPVGAYEFRPYPIYETWLDEVNECAGTNGKMRDIEFYAVPSRGFFLYGGGVYAGYFDKMADPDRMYLVEHDRENEGLVKHEFLHQEADTIGAHPTPPYEQCGPIWASGEIWRK